MDTVGMEAQLACSREGLLLLREIVQVLEECDKQRKEEARLDQQWDMRVLELRQQFPNLKVNTTAEIRALNIGIRGRAGVLEEKPLR